MAQPGWLVGRPDSMSSLSTSGATLLRQWSGGCQGHDGKPGPSMTDRELRAALKDLANLGQIEGGYVGACSPVRARRRGG